MVAVPLFLPAPKIALALNAKLDRAVKAAITRATLPRATMPWAITLADLGSATPGSGTVSSLPVGGHEETREDYIASEAKAGVMFAAYGLRDMVLRYIETNSPATPKALFDGLRSDLDATIARASALVQGGAVEPKHRVPSYETMFTATGAAGKVSIGFSSTYRLALDDMMISSDNTRAGDCIRGMGYGYLNGALAAAGLFDTTNKNGIWVAGDFSFGKRWPYIRIDCSNDCDADGCGVAQAGTSRTMAQLMAIMLFDNALRGNARDEMTERLRKTAAGEARRGMDQDQSFLTRSDLTDRFPAAAVTHNKIGIGPLKAGGKVYSEILVLKGVGTRSYIVSYQNFLQNDPYSWEALVGAVRDSITAYEGP